MYIFFKYLLSISRSTKRSILITVDFILLIGALWLSFSLRLENWYWPLGGFNNPIVFLVLIAPVFAVPIFAQFGLYRAIIRYLGMRATWSIVKAVTLYAVLWGVVVFLSGIQGVPRSVVLINAMVAVLAIGGSRMGARWLLRKTEDSLKVESDGIYIRASDQSRVVVYGAGAAGRQLAVGLGQSRECILLAFVDDNIELQGRDLMGVPILSRENLRTFVADQRIDDILLAIPSITRKQRSVIIEGLRPLNARIRTLPGLIEMARGKVDYRDLHDLDINDLLSREPAEPDEAMLQEQVSKATVMVTGAGGSIGSELCRQILRRKPKVLLLFESSEFALYTLHNELLDSIHYFTRQEHSSAEIEILPDIIPLLGSVSDENRVSDVIQTWKPSIIYHAAAVKHVPIVEQNIAECIKTNVLGTLVMAKVAAEQQVKRFILISTDKAVNPTNAMGASKRCCEMVLQALAEEQHPSFEPMWDGTPSSQIVLTTQFAIVRFGNVLGSSGSVVPHFRKQIAQGGPITLTHKDITRYFMTIPEAAQLVMQTGTMVGDLSQGIGGYRNQHAHNGADVYVLDMGDPVKIYDLACRMIEHSGFQIKDYNSLGGDIAIELVGLRPGEKLYEELLIGHNTQKTEHPRVMRAREKHLPWDELKPMLKTLQVAALNGDVMMIRAIFKNLVPEYIPDEKIADWVYKEQLKQL
ncbi:nucleoside-diphosphate sugar epimerase/dehydratase [Candidatus Njordibacter sp. Uisw_039]|uniref:polysaccharide biosynthesis protein n=1 Tax=Candidatus Njordibacter sp. Uisw_039 TaxID=3230972 RepID=UPI003D423396